MPEAPDATDFLRNSSLVTTPATDHAKLQSCSDLEKAQHGLYQAAHVFYAVSLLIPHHTFSWSIFVTRALMGLAYALVTVWACLELCAPDVFAWNLLLTAATSVHIVYWSWHFRPGRIRQRPLLELYQKLFVPLDCPRELFFQLTKKSVIRQLQVGDDYFAVAAQQQQHSTLTSNPSDLMRLSVLLTGKMRVTFGLANRLLHHIEPFQFIDSPEWYMMQNALPSQDAKSCSKPQVSITASEPSTVLLLDPDQLRQVTISSPSLRFLLDCLVGKDVSQKLYAVAEQASLMGATRGHKQGRLPSLQVGGGGGSVGVNSTATHSSLGPWQGELLRSQSADAVHTCKQGQVRSIHWRRDQTRKIWARRYQKLVPSHHHNRSPLMMKSAVNRRDSSPRSRRSQLEDESDDCMQSLLLANGGNAKCSTTAGSSSSRQQQQIRHPAHQHHHRHWNNKVQFDETFV